MRKRTARIALVSALLGAMLLPSHGQQAHSHAFESASRKFAWIKENGERVKPSTTPTVVNADEWNAYLNEGGVKLPEGISEVRIFSEPGVAHGEAEVDFDSLTSNRTRSNPLLFLFTGKHQVSVTAQAEASGGAGEVLRQTPRLAPIFLVRCGG